MGDNSFNIPPSERREPKRFEPPPWERDAFLERERQQAQESEAPVADQPAAPEAAPAEAPSEPEPGPPMVAEKKPAVIEEARMIELMAGLAAEEPKAGAGLWRFAIGVALFLAALGGVLVIWGVAAIVGSSRTGAVGATGGSVILLFGGGFIAAAVWLTLRTLRQRGVL